MPPGKLDTPVWNHSLPVMIFTRLGLLTGQTAAHNGLARPLLEGLATDSSEAWSDYGEGGRQLRTVLPDNRGDNL